MTVRLVFGLVDHVRALSPGLFAVCVGVRDEHVDHRRSADGARVHVVASGLARVDDSAESGLELEVAASARSNQAAGLAEAECPAEKSEAASPSSYSRYGVTVWFIPGR